MKSSLFALLTLMSLCSFAAGPALIIYPGEEHAFNIAEVSDLAENIVTIEFSLTQEMAGQSEPLVKIVEQTDGFSCEVQSVRKISSFFFMSKVRETYHAQLSWIAGQSWSSCTVEVSHSDFLNSKVILYTE